MKLLGMLLALTMLASGAMATPEAATWRRQSLIGENADHFFRYVTTSEYPASHYSHRRTLRLEKVRKSDLRVVERFPLRDTAYSQNLDTGAWFERSEALPPFDLSGYLTRNSVHLPFAMGPMERPSTRTGPRTCSW